MDISLIVKMKKSPCKNIVFEKKITPIGAGGNGPPGSQYRIPDELQEILLDFTVNYLIEQPSDIARFGVEYFVKLTATRTNKNEDDHSDDESMLSDEEIRRNGLNIQVCKLWQVKIKLNESYF